MKDFERFIIHTHGKERMECAATDIWEQPVKDDKLVIRTDGQERTVGPSDGNWEQPPPAASFEVGASEKYIVANNPDILAVRSETVEVIRIAPDGRLFWHGREVTTDDDFRAAMLYLAEWLRTPIP